MKMRGLNFRGDIKNGKEKKEGGVGVLKSRKEGLGSRGVGLKEVMIGTGYQK